LGEIKEYKMCKGMHFLKNNIQIIATVLSIVSMALFWIFTMNGIPAEIERLNGEIKISFDTVNKRVDTIDDRLRVAEQNLEKNSTKTDLTLQAVYEIRGLLLRK
jgi:hypothetical protein